MNFFESAFLYLSIMSDKFTGVSLSHSKSKLRKMNHTWPGKIAIAPVAAGPLRLVAAEVLASVRAV